MPPWHRGRWTRPTYPGVDPKLLVPGSLVFQKLKAPVDLRAALNSRPCRGGSTCPARSWRRPEGPGSHVGSRAEHPVVHVAWEDVCAYAEWAGKEIPTEAEWEFAARGGIDGALFTWGDESNPDGQVMANTWQGEFPWQNLLQDGYERTSPVGSFPANGYGLYDMAGNVWEWTSDYYAPRHGEKPSIRAARPLNPRVSRRSTATTPPTPAAAHIPRARHQRWLASVRAQLLSALPSSGASATDGRQLDVAHRLSLRRPLSHHTLVESPQRPGGLQWRTRE